MDSQAQCGFGDRDYSMKECNDPLFSAQVSSKEHRLALYPRKHAGKASDGLYSTWRRFARGSTANAARHRSRRLECYKSSATQPSVNQSCTSCLNPPNV